MRKSLRINYIIIAVIFFAVAVAGVLVASLLGGRMSKSALWYGSGTQDDPYRIYDANQLYNLRELSSSPIASQVTDGKYFSLESDVRVEGYVTTTTRYGFGGILDGNGHKVTLGEQGLFYRLKDGAVVRNLNLELSLTFTGKSHVYGLAGLVQNGALIENCNVSGKITISFRGLSQKYTMHYIVSTFKSVAPICITNNGTVRGCTFRGSIVQEDDTNGWGGCYVSGLVDSGSGIVESCTFEGDICIGVGAVYLGVGGLSYLCAVKDSTFNGNLTIYPNGKWLVNYQTYATWNTLHRKASLSRMFGFFGLARKATGCTFNGDLIYDYRDVPFEPENLLLTAEEDNTTNTHNGENLIVNTAQQSK